MKITMIRFPHEEDWIGAKQRALVTAGLKMKNPPDMTWKKKSLLGAAGAGSLPLRQI